MTATQVRRIDEVAVVFNGKTPSKSEQRDSGHPVLKVKDVDALGRFRGTFSGHVGADLARKHVKQQLAGGETLVLNAAHNATHVASKTFYADREVAGSLATGEWLIVRWSTEAVDSRFGNHWINAPDTRFRIRRLVNGIHLYPKDVARLRIPLPPLAEQKRIAGILDAADALRAKRREALAQLDTLLQSTFLDMFGDPVSNPMGWEEHEVEKVCRLVRGSSPRPKGDPQFYDGPVPRLMVSDITRDGFWVTPRIDSLTEAGAKKSRRVPAGTVVMAVSGEVGVVATVQDPCCVHDGFVAFLDLDESVFDSRFFMFQFHSLKMTHERRKAGAIFQNLTTRDIKAMRLPTPTIDLQHRFAAIVQSVEQQKTSQRAHLAELDTLFASLQSRAFRGDL